MPDIAFNSTVSTTETSRPTRDDPFAERAAANDDVALFDVGDRVQIEVTGRDRLSFLHNFCTNDIKKLQPEQGCEAFITNVKGKVLGHIFVFAEAESLWIESVAGSAATLIAHLDHYLIREDVKLTDRSAEFTEFLLVGPRSAEVLEQLNVPVGELPLNGHSQCRLLAPIAMPLRSVRRVDWLDLPTWLLSIGRSDSDAAWHTLTQAGACPSGESAFHALRIAAGFPLYGIDISEEQLAQEVSRSSRAISFTKGCYLGQEPIARIDAMGHVNRELRRLEVSTGPLPTPGMVVLDKPVPDGKPIGQITSAAWSLRSRDDDKPLALAYLRSGFTASGMKVIVGEVEAIVL